MVSISSNSFFIEAQFPETHAAWQQYEAGIKDRLGSADAAIVRDGWLQEAVRACVYLRRRAIVTPTTNSS